MRKILAVALTFAMLAAAFPFTPVSKTRVAEAAEVAGLEDILLNGLEARRPVDRAFIRKVVQFVKDDKLPLKPVMETFDYCRKNYDSKRRAIVFQILLRRRAKAMGVKI